MTKRTLAIATGVLIAGSAAAADLPNTKAAPAPPPTWWSTVTVNGEIDAGIMGNPDAPSSGLNWGRLFDQTANEPMLNTGVLTIQRATGSAGYDVGFMLQGAFGTDNRFTHNMGEGEYWINSKYQLSLMQAYLSVHTPWITPGGIDWKLGQWSTIEGVESFTDPSANLFYSHSYLFNYPEPFTNFGVLAITHINPTVDIYTGISSGNQATLVPYVGDNNDAPAFEGGVGLNKLFGGAVTVMATTHIGPENPYFQADFPLTGNNAANTSLVFENDLNATWTVTDKITAIGQVNYTKNDFTGGSTYGGVGYVSWQTPYDWLKVNGRAEVFRDNGNGSGGGTYVCAYPGNFDWMNALHGFPNTVYCGPPTTYFEFTAGLNITPTIPSSVPFVKAVIFRPEVRYDTSLNGTTPFGVPSGSTIGTKSDMVTIGGDVVVKF
ncbi:MAG: outer membrane beta-barrel protein [Pseudomonadota bacterium]